MRKKIYILLAVFSCLGMLAITSCKDGEDPAKGENDFVVNTTPNIGGADSSYEKEDEDPYVKKCSVIFITSDENIKIPAQSVEKGAKANKPVISRDGYTFLGWYTANGDKWDFETMSVNDHLMLTAWWNKN